jgi:hypothetical protein
MIFWAATDVGGPARQVTLRLDFCFRRYLDNYDVLCLQEFFSTMNCRKAWFMKLAVRRGFRCVLRRPRLILCFSFMLQVVVIAVAVSASAAVTAVT